MFLLLCALSLLCLLIPGRCYAQETHEEDARASSCLRLLAAIARCLFSGREDPAEAAEKALSLLREGARAERADLWQNKESEVDPLAIRHGSGTARAVSLPKLLPGWFTGLSEDSVIRCAAGAANKTEQDFLAADGLRSALLVPIHFQGCFWGFLLLGSLEEDAPWGKEEEAPLRCAGFLLAAAFRQTQTLNALIESEDRFSDLVAATGEIIWEVDADGRFTCISERIQEITGHEPEDFLGKSWENFLPPDQNHRPTTCMFEGSFGSGNFRALEHCVLNKAGKLTWLQSSGKMLLGPDGIAGLRGVSQDITNARLNSMVLTAALKELANTNSELQTSVRRAQLLAEKAETASQSKSEFMANISREIRTPLNSVLGLTYLLTKTAPSSQQAEYLGKLQEAGLSLQEKINSMFEFSSLESQKARMAHLPFQMDSIFENLARIYGPKAEERGLSLTLVLRREVPRRFRGDAARLGQVLGHLVDNAVKFTQRGGVALHVYLERREGSQALLRFLIVDTGIGITREQQDKLFLSLAPDEASPTRRYGGPGLGLTLAKRILDMSGGSLQLDSSPDKGTRITVRASLEIEDDTIPQDDFLFPGVNILLIIEEDLERSSLIALLQDANCVVHDFAGPGGLKETGNRLPPLGGRTVCILDRPLFPLEILALLRDACGLEGKTPLLYILSGEDAASLSTSPGPVFVLRRPLTTFNVQRALDSLLSGREQPPDGPGDPARGRETDLFPDRGNGLDLEAALQNMGGDRALLAAAQTRFYQNHSQAEAEILNLLADDDREEVVRRLRDIHRQAVGLAAKKLVENAVVLEQRLLDGPIQDNDICLMAFLTELSIVIVQLRDLQPSEEYAKDKDNGQDILSLCANLHTLNELIRDDDAFACTLFATLTPSLESVDIYRTRAAAKALAVFDFSSALTFLQEMENALAAREK
ncbi:MAG: PAS domain S-box protein [Desulfovibrio sp.]|nr:PAS domain S-box protein [Desulfovibrio sp.]